MNTFQKDFVSRFDAKNCFLHKSLTQAIKLGTGMLVLANAAMFTAVGVNAAEGDSRVLEEIIVTANKRSESIDDVSMSIAALSGDELAKKGITSVADLAKSVPGFSATPASYGTEVYTIRGVGFYDTTLAAVPTVSVYVDEVPVPFSVMTPSAALDPERVEVLKGPQGTLFGQNSTGGAINFIAAKPTDEFEGRVNTTIGNYDTMNVSGYVSGPLSDTVRARLSLQSKNSNEGWQKSISRDDELGEIDQQMARLLVEWTPSDRLTLLFNANGFTDQSDTLAPRFQGESLATPAFAFTVPDLIAAPAAPDGARNADWDPDQQYDKDNKMFQFSVRMDYDINDNLTLTNIAAYSDYSHDQNQDVDGLDYTNVRYHVFGDIRNFSDEVRIAGQLTEDAQFVVGASYQTGIVDQFELGYIDIYTTSFIPPIVAGSRNIPGVPRMMEFTDFADQDIESYAVFGNIDYDLSDALILHVGARYTDSTTEAQGCSTGDGGLTFLQGLNQPPGQCVTILTTTPRVAGVAEDELSEDNISWRLGLDYNVSDDIMVYATASRGYKAGSFPVLATANFEQFRPVTQEELTAYELGFKGNLFDSTLRLNAAVFHYDYSDKQIRAREDRPPFGNLEVLLNIPDSEVDGAELTFDWLATGGLMIKGGFSYIETQINNFQNFDADNRPIDLDGAEFPNAPSLQSSLGAQYDWSVSEEIDGFVGVDYNYVSSTRGTIGFTPGLDMPSYDLIDARLGVAGIDGSWQAMLWAKNLTDEFYLLGANKGGEALFNFAGMPRTFGVSLSYGF